MKWRNLLTLMATATVGALAGVALGLTTPTQEGVAQAGIAFCRCSDDGSGKYKCSGDHMACLTGDEWCIITCIDT